MTTHYALIGAGGFGRETMPLAGKMLERKLLREDGRLVFVVEGRQTQTQCNGYPLISLDDLKALDGDKFFNIAISVSDARERISRDCMDAGMAPFSIIAENHVCLDHNHIAEGCILCPFTTITANAGIGRFFHANIYAYVAHDCVIGDYVTFAPKVCCNGYIHIEDHVYIGTGAIIKPGSKQTPLVIGHHAVIGMGAVVTKDVAPYETVVGNPARPMEKNRP